MQLMDERSTADGKVSVWIAYGNGVYRVFCQTPASNPDANGTRYTFHGRAVQAMNEIFEMQARAWGYQGAGWPGPAKE